MTDATERRLAGLLAQISEMIDSRLPQEGIKSGGGFAMWQFWVVIGTMLFYSGATWFQIQENSKAIAEHMEWDVTKTDKLQATIKDNGDSLVAHMQWELEHELAAKDAQIKKLRRGK